MDLKSTFKRGALIAAANWQIALVQTVADSAFKMLIAVPIAGGVLLVALVLGAEPKELAALDWRDLTTTIVAALAWHPLVLTTFLLALAVVVIGGSVFVFLVKGGAVATLVDSDRNAGPIEQPPLRLSRVARAGRFTPEGYVDGCRRLFPRFLRLGAGLLTAYLVSGVAYVSVIWSGGWGLTALLTALFVAWITVVNLIYLLLQIVVAADDCSVGAAVGKLAAFLRTEIRPVAAVFAVILALLVSATGASILATAAFGLISFVPIFGPLFGLAVLPLQVLAWLLRSVVFQYLGLTAIGAYLRLYREHATNTARHDELRRVSLEQRPATS